MKKQEKGQLIIMLILVMTIGLAIALSIIQKSLVDVSTATKVEQSSKAFSAAEAGVENALKGSSTVNPLSVGGDSQATISDAGLLPLNQDQPTNNTNRQSPIEYPALAKEDIAQIWLASYFSSTNPPPAYYKGTQLDVFWGTPGGTDATAYAGLELSIVYYDSSVTPAVYKINKVYLDNPNALTALVGGVARTNSNKFTSTGVTCDNNQTPQTPVTGSVLTYQCKGTVSLPYVLNTKTPIMIRARLLYNTTSQGFAVQAYGTCGKPCSLPPQARRLTSIGTSGSTQRKVQVFQMNKVVPTFFDYAIFSAGDITK